MTTSNKEVRCNQCKEHCIVEGEYPKFHVWCDACNDYANIDLNEYTANYMGDMIDYIYDTYKDSGGVKGH